MGLLKDLENGKMGLQSFDGQKPDNLPLHDLDPTSFKNGTVIYGDNPGNPGKAVGSNLDLEDSGPINVPDNKHTQKYSPKSGDRYLENLPT